MRLWNGPPGCCRSAPQQYIYEFGLHLPLTVEYGQGRREYVTTRSWYRRDFFLRCRAQNRRCCAVTFPPKCARPLNPVYPVGDRSEEHTSELQSLRHLVCRLL